MILVLEGEGNFEIFCFAGFDFGAFPFLVGFDLVTVGFQGCLVDRELHAFVEHVDRVGVVYWQAGLALAVAQLVVGGLKIKRSHLSRFWV